MRAKTKQPSSNLQLSSEQQLFVDCAMQRQDACIGSGKTTAIRHLCNVLPRGLTALHARGRQVPRYILRTTNELGYRRFSLSFFMGFGLSARRRHSLPCGAQLHLDNRLTGYILCQAGFWPTLAAKNSFRPKFPVGSPVTITSKMAFSCISRNWGNLWMHLSLSGWSMPSAFHSRNPL